MKILIAEDEKLFANLISDFLKTEGHSVEVIFEPSNISDTINNFAPDLILLDLYFPNQEGIDALKKVKSINNNIPVIIISSNIEPSLIKRAFKNQAKGYLTKNISKEDLLLAIDTVLSGGKYVSDRIKETLVNDAILNDNNSAELKKLLSDKEIKVLELISEGMTSEEIADELYISSRTVDAHRKNIMEKFKTNRITKVLKIAFENNII